MMMMMATGGSTPMNTASVATSASGHASEEKDSEDTDGDHLEEKEGGLSSSNNKSKK